MFRSFTEDDGKCKLVDDNFTFTFRSEGRISTKTASIIREYQRRNLPVAPNIARLYLHMRFGWDSDYATKRELLDERFPELEFGKRYYGCVLRQVKQLQFGKRKR